MVFQKNMSILRRLHDIGECIHLSFSSFFHRFIIACVEFSAYKKRKQDAESGQAFLLFILVLVVAVGTSYAIEESQIPAASHTAILTDQTHYLNRVQKQLSQWYKANAYMMDKGGGGSSAPVNPTSGQPINSSTILEQAGVPIEHNVEAFVSKEECSTGVSGLVSSQICYHNIWLAIPGMTGAAPTLTAGITFSPGSAIWTEVTGETVEARLINLAQNQLSDISSKLEQGYAAYIGSGAVHNVNSDWFIPQGCGQYGNGVGQFGCSNGGFVPLGQLNLAIAVAFGSSYFTNPWGIPLYGENDGTEGNDAQPPYTFTIQSPLPWNGDYIQNTAVQPL